MVRKSFWQRLFPEKYDFYSMISSQTQATTSGVKHLNNWLGSRSSEDYQLLMSEVDEADKSRLEMENDLIEAFATPFDRQEIYSLSVNMDRIIEYAKSTLVEMEAFQVSADHTIMKMVEQLMLGTNELAEAISVLKEDPLKTQKQIVNIRRAQTAIENQYREGMAELFNGPDIMHAIKYREVYHHIKDAGTHLGYTTDVLHRVVVRLV